MKGIIYEVCNNNFKVQENKPLKVLASKFSKSKFVVA